MTYPLFSRKEARYLRVMYHWATWRLGWAFFIGLVIGVAAIKVQIFWGK